MPPRARQPAGRVPALEFREVDRATPDRGRGRARKRGASVVEAYPVDPDSPSYRFMGFVSSFTAAGFHEVGRAGSRRHVMRLKLKPR